MFTVARRPTLSKVVTRLEDVALSVKRLQNRHHRELDARLRAVGSSLSQWDALRHIDRHPGSSTHELAELTFMSDQSFGALAIKLAEQGLVERLPGRGRVVLHTITADGAALLAKATPVVEAIWVASFAPLAADELDAFAALLRRLLSSTS